MSFGPFGAAGPITPGELPWVTQIHSTETLTRRPPASGANKGLLFFATDLGSNVGYTLYRSDGTQWVPVGVTPIGSTNIITLGTVTTGVWNATIVGLLYGGTGANLSAQGPGVLRQATNGATVTTGQALDYILLQDQKAQNTQGGTFTSGSWQTRTLNTEAADTGGNCSLSSNQFTLDAGTYRIRARAPAAIVGRHQIRLQNITDGSTTLVGSSAYADAGNSVINDSWIAGRFTIAGTKTFELQHQCAGTVTTTGFGAAANFTTEIYAEVELWREIS